MIELIGHGLQRRLSRFRVDLASLLVYTGKRAASIMRRLFSSQFRQMFQAVFVRFRSVENHIAWMRME